MGSGVFVEDSKIRPLGPPMCSAEISSLKMEGEDKPYLPNDLLAEKLGKRQLLPKVLSKTEQNETGKTR